MPWGCYGPHAEEEGFRLSLRAQARDKWPSLSTFRKLTWHEFTSPTVAKLFAPALDRRVLCLLLTFFWNASSFIDIIMAYVAWAPVFGLAKKQGMLCAHYTLCFWRWHPPTKSHWHYTSHAAILSFLVQCSKCNCKSGSLSRQKRQQQK